MKRMKMKEASMKGLPLPQKARFVWDYYRFRMVVLVSAAVFCAYLANHLFINPPRQPVFVVAWMAGSEWPENIDSLTASLTPALSRNPNRQPIEIIPFLRIGSPQYDIALQSQLEAKMVSNEIDLVIATFEGMADMGVSPHRWFQNIQPFLEAAEVNPADVRLVTEVETEPVFEMAIDPETGAEVLIEIPAPDENLPVFPFGAMLDNSEVFYLSEIETEGRFVAVMFNTHREEAVLEVLREIWETLP